MPGNLSEWMDRQMDVQAIKRSQFVRWIDGPMYVWKDGILGFRWTDGQHENIIFQPHKVEAYKTNHNKKVSLF